MWIVVDALRPDALPSFHDDAEDARQLGALHPPLEALLPRIPGLTPAIDDLATRGVRFTHAYSAASTTGPGTLAMLSGARSSELGLDTQRALHPSDVARFYASDPPLLPLLARRHGASTHAFSNDAFMLGYAPGGVDMGFEHAVHPGDRTRGALEITRDASAWLEANKETRFFLFVNYAFRPEPHDPPPQFLARVPPPPAGPADPAARLYMAEAAENDEAIGVLLRSLAVAGLRERTIVVVTAAHGETLSSAHGGRSERGRVQARLHHVASHYEEMTRVPILIVAPGLLPEDRAVTARVRSVDLAPTIAELLGLEASTRFSGRSLVGLAKGRPESGERVVVTEGRGTRAIMHGRYRLVVREDAAPTMTSASRTVTADEQLFDLVEDPGERRDLARDRPELVAEMRARLVAAIEGAPVAGSLAAGPPGAEGARPPVICLRLVGGGRARRVSGAITIGDPRNKARAFTVEPVQLGPDAIKMAAEKVEVAVTTRTEAAVGFDIVVDPPSTPVTWELYLDDQPWPEDAVFGGPYGLLAPALRRGLNTDASRLLAASPLLPPIDPRRDVGLFVVRDRGGNASEAREASETLDDPTSGGTARLLRDWRCAQAPAGAK